MQADTGEWPLHGLPDHDLSGWRFNMMCPAQPEEWDEEAAEPALQDILFVIDCTGQPTGEFLPVQGQCVVRYLHCPGQRSAACRVLQVR